MPCVGEVRVPEGADVRCQCCRRDPCGCVIVADGTRYRPALRVCGQPVEADGLRLGCVREEGHEPPCSPGPALGAGQVAVLPPSVVIVDAEGREVGADEAPAPCVCGAEVVGHHGALDAAAEGEPR